MGAIGNLIPLVLLFAVVAGVGWVGYQVRHLPPRSWYTGLTAATPTDLSLHQRAHRTRRPQAGEEKRGVYERRGASRRQGSKG